MPEIKHITGCRKCLLILDGTPGEIYEADKHEDECEGFEYVDLYQCRHCYAISENPDEICGCEDPPDDFFAAQQQNYFILQGGAENLHYFEHNERYVSRDIEFFWTCPKQAKKRDTAFVYLCAPESRIVGQVKLVGEPFFNSGDMFENPVMKEKWCVEIGEVKYFPHRRELTMKGLRELFGADWGWVRYPRGNTKIPAHIIEPFMELISDGREGRS